jgi:hypothetical protein
VYVRCTRAEPWHATLKLAGRHREVMNQGLDGGWMTRVAVRIGVTGHQILPPAAAGLATRHWARTLSGCARLCAVSSLAEGADQLFAQHVLDAGGQLEVIEPCVQYGRSLPNAVQDRYQRLLRAAGTVITLPFPEPSNEAFLAAGLILVERCDSLFALWDGEAARGLGGTADIVAYARTRGREVTILWPEGLVRQ